jgi:hypothetical protein
MKKPRNFVPPLLALAVFVLLVAEFPPFQITWHRFFEDPAPLARKLGFLLRAYGLPFCMSFFAIIFMQMQGRLAMVGATASSIFPLALFGSAGMLAAFRSMTSGVGGVPGYAMGFALAYTIMSRVHSIQPTGRLVLGRPMLRIVWRGELEAQRAAAARLQAREARAESAQRSVSMSTSNSEKNNALSLRRAEAGM